MPKVAAYSVSCQRVFQNVCADTVEWQAAVCGSYLCCICRIAQLGPWWGLWLFGRRVVLGCDARWSSAWERLAGRVSDGELCGLVFRCLSGAHVCAGAPSRLFTSKYSEMCVVRHGILTRDPLVDVWWLLSAASLSMHLDGDGGAGGRVDGGRTLQHRARGVIYHGSSWSLLGRGCIIFLFCYSFCGISSREIKITGFKAMVSILLCSTHNFS